MTQSNNTMTIPGNATEKKIKEIQLGDRIGYVPSTPNYGRAEFVICPVFKRGYLIELYVFPKQQETTTWCYKLTLPHGITVIGFACYGKENIKVWTSGWCKEHKCYSLEFYVPADDACRSIKFATHFGNNLALEFHTGWWEGR